MLDDGTFLTAYHITLGDGVTHIAASHWSRDYVGPRDLLRGAAAVPKPVAVTPGETYALTVYNRDYVGGGKTRLADGLTGDHSWYLNSGRGQRRHVQQLGRGPGLQGLRQAGAAADAVTRGTQQ